jgi:hypothetical protein
MQSRHFLASALGAALFATTGAALADDFFGGDPDAGHRRRIGGLESRWEGSRIGLDTDLWPAKSSFVAAMGIGAQIELHRNFALDFDMSWAAGNLSSGLGGDRQTAGAFGNITLGGHGMVHVAPDALLFGGATFTIPTRYDFSGASLTSVFLQTLGTVSRGYFDVHRLMPGTFAARIPLGAEVKFASYFYYRGTLVPVILVPVAKDFNDKSAQLIIEHADEIEARAPFGFGGGLRFQVAFAATNFGGTGLGSGGFGGGDHAQTALEPFIGYEPRGSGFFARLGLLVALDSPAGFGFDAGKLATIRTTLGGKF